MSRAYIRLDPGFFERKVVDQGYTLAEAMTLVGALCLGEQQTPRGRFRNERLLRALLGPASRHVPNLIARGDLVVEKRTGRIYVDGWDEWQEGDVTVKERMARVRSRRVGRTAPDRNTDRNARHGDDRHRPSRPAKYVESEASDGTGSGTGQGSTRPSATTAREAEPRPALSLVDPVRTA